MTLQKSSNRLQMFPNLSGCDDGHGQSQTLQARHSSWPCGEEALTQRHLSHMHRPPDEQEAGISLEAAHLQELITALPKKHFKNAASPRL